MTLQIVDISALGIVCAADSAITFRDDRRKIVGQTSWPKLFTIDRLNAVIGYYGRATIRSQNMPNWLEAFIRRAQSTTLQDIALELQEKLNKELSRSTGDEGTGFHLAGYTLLDQVNVPSFYHIWNHKGVDEGYKLEASGFRAASDFLERDAKEYAPHNLNNFFEEKFSQVYRNGALKRYNELADSLYEFTKRSWSRSLIKRPKTIEDWAWYYRFQLETVKQMYRYLIKDRFPPIGFEIDVYMINPTGRIKRLSNHPKRES